jgi:hypothetical protein
VVRRAERDRVGGAVVLEWTTWRPELIEGTVVPEWTRRRPQREGGRPWVWPRWSGMAPASRWREGRCGVNEGEEDRRGWRRDGVNRADRRRDGVNRVGWQRGRRCALMLQDGHHSGAGIAPESTGARGCRSAMEAARSGGSTSRWRGRGGSMSR